MLPYVCACAKGMWHLHIHPPGQPDKGKRVKFKCRSWRHEGECRAWKNAQDFTRIVEALDTFHDWTFHTLTFRPSDWPSKWHIYKRGGECWGRLQKRLARQFGTFKYVQTWERFKKGGAHLHVIISSAAIISAVASCARFDRDGNCLFLRSEAAASGFGWRVDSKRLSGEKRAMAGYLNKISSELTGKGKAYQIPVDAPSHFRRIRASRGTLPPPHKSDWTGRLIFCPLDRYQISDNLVKRLAGSSAAGTPF